MQTNLTESVLKSAGISAAVIASVVLIGGAFLMYKMVLDTELVKLNIEKLKREKAGL